MAIVDYSDTDDEQDTRPAKRSKGNDLPSLPSTFLDLYSSTVRSSTHDDPSLHGGRTRVIPHIAGNWPAHVYLEWYPKEDDLQCLSSLVHHVESEAQAIDIHSLLRSDLGVTLPLHISLSRPLVLKADQKEAFLTKLQDGIRASNVDTVAVQPRALRWHPNEVGSRHFLVVQLEHTAKDELAMLLDCCNKVAADSGQPLLYAATTVEDETMKVNQFHVSVAWTLDHVEEQETKLPAPLVQELTNMCIIFGDVKMRIGQDVTTIPLAAKQQSKERSLFL